MQEKLLAKVSSQTIGDQLIDAAFVHEIYKTEVMKCCQPFESLSLQI